MPSGPIDATLVAQLLRIAREPDLRQRIYERLGDYCHQCRNRLNSLKLSLYLAMKQSTLPSTAPWAEIERHYQELEWRVEQVQTLCRPLSLSRITIGLDLLIEDRRESWARSMAAGGKALEFVPPPGPAVASFDVDRLGRALDSIVAWRAGDRAAAGPARLRWWSESGLAHVEWEEPPGADRLGEESASAWALPMLARVVLAHGGDCRIDADRGWRLEITWPAVATTS